MKDIHVKLLIDPTSPQFIAECDYDGVTQNINLGTDVTINEAVMKAAMKFGSNQNLTGAWIGTRQENGDWAFKCEFPGHQLIMGI